MSNQETELAIFVNGEINKLTVSSDSELLGSEPEMMNHGLPPLGNSTTDNRWYLGSDRYFLSFNFP